MKIKEFWNKIQPAYKLAAIVGLLTMAYSELAIKNEIFFFWESYVLGSLITGSVFCIILGTELIIVIGLLNKKYRNYGRTGFLIFSLILMISVVISIQTSEQLETAKEHLVNDPTVIEQVGTINGFTWLSAEVGSETTTGVKERTGRFELVVKGTIRYETYIVELYRRGTDDWEITAKQTSR